MQPAQIRKVENSPSVIKQRISLSYENQHGAVVRVPDQDLGAPGSNPTPIMKTFWVNLGELETLDQTYLAGLWKGEPRRLLRFTTGGNRGKTFATNLFLSSVQQKGMLTLAVAMLQVNLTW